MKKIFIEIIFLFVLIKSEILENEEKCEEIQPFEDIIEDCTKYKINNTNKICCYMEINFDEGYNYLCYPVEKNKGAIKNEINKLKNNYERNKSINIDCSSSFIEFYFYFIIAILSLFF